MKKESTREKIIIHAIECLNERGIHGLTVREVAKRAQVNIAAINYYFGDKNKLLEEIFARTLAHAFADEEAHQVLEADATSFESKFRQFLVHLLEGAIRYPGIVRAHLYNCFLNENYDLPAIKQFNEFFMNLVSKIKNISPSLPSRKLKLKVMAILGATLFCGLFPAAFAQASDLDFRKLRHHREYINVLLQALPINISLSTPSLPRNNNDRKN